MKMETESKTEVNGGLECPDVDRDSKADFTESSTLGFDVELSNDSPKAPERPGENGNGSGEDSPPVYESEHDARPQTTEDDTGAEVVHPESSKQENLNEQQTLIEEAASTIDSQNSEFRTEESALSVVDNTEKIPAMNESVAPPRTTEESALSVVDNTEKIPTVNESVAPPRTTEDAAGAETICLEISNEDISNDQQTSSCLNSNEPSPSTKDPQDPETLTAVSAESVVDPIEQMPDMRESGALLQTTEAAACTEAIHPETSKEFMLNEPQTPNEEAASSKDSHDSEICTEEYKQSVVDSTEKMPISNESIAPPQTTDEAAGVEAILSEISNEDISNDQQESNELVPSPKDAKDPETRTGVTGESVVDTIEPIPVMSESVPSQTKSEVACDKAIHPETSNEVILNEQQTLTEVAALPTDTEMCTQESADVLDIIGQMLALSESEDDSQGPIDDVPICVNCPNGTSQPDEESEHVATCQATEQFCMTGTVSLCAAGELTDETHYTDAMAVDHDSRELKNSEDPNPCTPDEADSVPCTRCATDDPAKMCLDEMESISKEHPGGNQSSTGSLGIDEKNAEVSKVECHPNSKHSWQEIEMSSNVTNVPERSQFLVDVYCNGKEPNELEENMGLNLDLSKISSNSKTDVVTEQRTSCSTVAPPRTTEDAAGAEAIRLEISNEDISNDQQTSSCLNSNEPSPSTKDPQDPETLTAVSAESVVDPIEQMPDMRESGALLQTTKAAACAEAIHPETSKEFMLNEQQTPNEEAASSKDSHDPEMCTEEYKQSVVNNTEKIPISNESIAPPQTPEEAAGDPREAILSEISNEDMSNDQQKSNKLVPSPNDVKDPETRTGVTAESVVYTIEPIPVMSESFPSQTKSEVACDKAIHPETFNEVILNEKQTLNEVAALPTDSEDTEMCTQESADVLDIIGQMLALSESEDDSQGPIDDVPICVNCPNGTSQPDEESEHVATCQATEQLCITGTISLGAAGELTDETHNADAIAVDHDSRELKNSEDPNPCTPDKADSVLCTRGATDDPDEMTTDVVTDQTTSSASENPDNPNSETTEIAKLSLSQLNKYYKWRILGVSHSEGMVKAKEPGLIPQTEDPHPDCKLPWEEIKETALLIRAKNRRSKFKVEVFRGGKDPDEQLKLMMESRRTKRHPKCQHSWEELKQLCNELPKDSMKFKFIVNAFYGGKQPAALLKDMLSEVNVCDEPQNPPAMNDSSAVSEKSADSLATILEEGPIKELPNWKLKNYYVWRNRGADHSTALAKVSEMPLGEHSGHPNCQISESEVKQLAVPLCDSIQANRFYIHVYFGGKDPANTLKYFQPCSAVSDSSTDPIDTTIEEGPIIDIDNWQLKNYYLWRNSGKDHDSALANILCQPVKFNGQHPPHPNCRNSESEIKKMSVPLSANTVAVNRFFIHVYYGGKDPASTLKYLQSRPSVSYVYRDPTESPTLIEPDDLSSLSNFSLKCYYGWRTRGCVHAKALSNVRKWKPFSGELLPHRNCKISREEAIQMSLPLEHDQLKKERFFIHVFYGGKDPECTMRHFMPPPKSGPEDFLARHQSQMLENCLELGLSRNEAMAKAKRPISAQPLPFQPVAKRTRSCPDGQIIPLDNPEHPINILNCSELRNFYLTIHRGRTRTEAMIIARKLKVNLPTPKTFISKCLVNMLELDTMSNRLPAKLRPFFVAETFFGGSDPKEVIEYLLRRASNMTSQPNTDRVGDARKSSGCLDDELVPLDSPKHPINILSGWKLMRFYQLCNNGLSREEAIAKARARQGPFTQPKSTTSKCLVPKPKLEAMSLSLPDNLRKCFMAETFYGGSDPNEVKKYLLGKRNRVLFPFHNYNNWGGEIVALDSPEHPINMLNSHELKKFYLLVIEGYTRRNAMLEVINFIKGYTCRSPMLKVKNTFYDTSPPRNFVSRCSVSLEDLETMSNQLPFKFKNLFVVETFYGGSDPGKVMAYLLRKASAEDREPGIIPLDSPEHPINTLDFMELNCYYHWILKGFSRENAIAKVKSPHFCEPISGTFVSKSLISKKNLLNAISYCLPTQHQHVFVTECLYGGSEPGEVFEYLLAKAKRTENKQWPVEPQTNPLRNAGVPECQPQAPFAGMPALSNYADWNAAGSSSMHPQPPVYPQDQGYYQQAPSNFGHFGPTAVAPFPVAHPNPSCNHQQTPNFHPDPGHPPSGQPPPGQPPPGHPPSGHPTSGHPPMSYGDPPDIPVPQPFQPAASGLHHADLSRVPAGIPPVLYPSDQSPYIGLPPVLHPPHPIPTPAVPHQSGPSVTPTTPNVVVSSPLVHQSAVTTPSTKSAPPQKTAKCNTYDEYKPVIEELSKAMLPRKINLKSTLQDLNKSEQQPLRSTQKPKTTKTLDKKKPVQGDGSVPMHIVPTGYPHERLTEENMDAIENSLLEAILEMDDDGLKPSFKDSSRNDGRYNITCIDEFSVSWLYKYLSTYQPWPGASLKLISVGPKKMRASAVLPPCKADDDQKILKFIERQNKGLNVNLWKIVQRWNNGDFNTCIELIIDEESAEVLQKCSKINFKLGSAEIVIAKEDDQVLPDVGMSAVTGSSKTPTPFSSRNYRRASPPPPPKRMLSGESIPTPPKRPCNQERSRSSHDLEDCNSACRAPSRDRCSRSTSKSPSPAEKSSWMDWFYAKEKQSNVSPNGTHEIKHGQNYRHSDSRLSEDRGSGSTKPSHSSSKYRKRHVSRSPSQEYRSMSRSPPPDSSRRKKRYWHKGSYSRSPSPKDRRSSPGPSSRYYKY